MHLRSGEVVLRTVRRHKTPFIIKLITTFIAAVPLYAFIFVIGKEIDEDWLLGILAGLSFCIGIVVAIIGFDYLFDKVLITSRRVIWVDWKNPFNRQEHEAELVDIQDVDTHEKGLLSKLSIFDYGLLEISTAATQGCIAFKDCRSPEDVEHFIFKQIEAQHVPSGSTNKVSAGAIPHKNMQHEDEEWSVN